MELNFDTIFEEFKIDKVSIYISEINPYKIKPVRVLCSGKTLAFQANDAGSIPAARSTRIST